MKIKIAKTAGFCWGVKRALDLVLKTAKESKEKVYTYGPLIHNEDVVDILTDRGIKTVDPAKITALPRKAIIIIRAHGIAPDTRKKLEECGYRLIDATCPHVRVSQKKISGYAGPVSASPDGAAPEYQIIIAGDKKHAEVISLNGYAQAQIISGQAKKGGLKPIVVSSAREAALLKIKKDQPVCIVAQSTFQEEEYKKIITILKSKVTNLNVLNTICRSTTVRQREVVELSGQVEAMIVVGAHHSANTTRLAGLARSRGIPAFHVANVAELPVEELKKYQVVGLTAGTSTPDWVIQPVIEKLKKL